jgi:NAD(P)-dependent dehydrogenase (short-subunit alcohol dehydrogenase family)
MLLSGHCIRGACSAAFGRTGFFGERMGIPNLFDLTGRKALVTGASRGLGRGMAEALAAAGADVAVTARQGDALAETCAAIERAGRRAVAIGCDLSEAGSAAAGVERAAEALGGLDILVNNAGTEEVRPSLDVDDALWSRILDTNLKGAFFTAQAAARRMAATGGGTIVNICSLTAFLGVPTAVPYSASKAGLLAMTRALAVEWACHGIRVNAIAPGYFRTALTEIFYEDQDWQRRMLDRIPQRRFGTPDDLAGAVVFLAGPASAYVTGHCLAVDGGCLAAL